MPDGNDIMITLWGLLGGIMRILDAAVREHVIPTGGIIIANVLIAGFCGYLVARFAVKFDPDWATVGAGIGGYLGTRSIDILLAVFEAARTRK